VLFEDFVATRGQALQRFGYLLTSGWALAEDLLQASLARAYPRWRRIQAGSQEAYVRKIMVSTWSSWWRRRWRGEVPTAQLPDAAAPDQYAESDRRQTVGAALSRLPARQRAVLVLRYHQDMSEHQIAQLLGVSPGTVKSQAAKALARLRADGALDDYRSEPAGGK
jgi:RNA polymerase sigma-70 factor (sigma-E family)